MSLQLNSPLAMSWADDLLEIYLQRFGHQLTKSQLIGVVDAAQRVADRANLDVEDFVSLLRSMPIDSSLVQALLTASINKESYFFRDATSTESLREQILPELIERRLDTRTLRVWSAGCSTGEEIYTVSILLQEAIPDWERWSITLVATDIDASAMAFAKRAEYRKWSLRATTEAQRFRYFKHNPRTDYYKLRERYCTPVSFSLLNLAEPSAPNPAPGSFDLVLCRNVSIYFSQEARSRLASRIHGVLTPGGIWVSGPSDAAPINGFAVRVLPGMLAYSVQQPNSMTAGRTLVPPAAAPPSFHNSNFSVRLAPPEAPRRPDPSTKAANPIPPSRMPTNPELAVVQSYTEDLRKLLAEAETLADGANLTLALQKVEQAIELSPTSSRAYLLRSLIHDSAGNYLLAIEDLRRLLYLNPQCAEGYFRLGLLFSRIGKQTEAIRAMRNAVVTAAQSADADTKDIQALAGPQLARLLEAQNG